MDFVNISKKSGVPSSFQRKDDMKTLKPICSTCIALLVMFSVYSYASASSISQNSTVIDVESTINPNTLSEAQLQAVAKLLNISVETLKGDLTEGITIEDLAKKAGVSISKINYAIRTAKATSSLPTSSGYSDAQLKALSQVLNLDIDTLKGSLSEGATLEGLAANAGVSLKSMNAALQKAPTSSIHYISANEMNAGQMKRVAAVLNISVDTLKGDIAEGATLEGLAANAGIDVQKLYKAIRGR
jgi:hypothetical protein